MTPDDPGDRRHATPATVRRSRWCALAGLAIAVAFVVSVVGSTRSSSQPRAPSGSMSGMRMRSGTPSAHSKTGMQMHGMTPLVAGADGTTASAAGLTLKAAATAQRYALGVVLTAAGSATSARLPPPRSIATADGYTVGLTHGALKVSTESQLTFTVRRAGRPVTALEPYLGAYGHLVALRNPDLAYSHVHPTAHDGSRATITFAADFATAATYRLFMQFRAGGRVHTASYTLSVTR